jgi:Fic family protein
VLSFAQIERSIGSVPGSVVARLRRIDTGRGREELFRNQLPALFTELAHTARVESITASSALEGVVVPDRVRAAQIINGKAPVLRNRDEQEFAGYRGALDYLSSEDWRPLNVGLLLHLHKLLFEQTASGGGAFKSSDNLVVDRSPDGSVEVRFVPVPAQQTPFFIAELVTRFNAIVSAEDHHPLLLVGLFVLDLLTIHPFDDGNGRVARALTNALLEDAGYGVGRYVSVEQLIAGSADAYYAALLASTHGWQGETNDPWPWLKYFIELVGRAYDTFEARAAAGRSTGTKQVRVRDYVLGHAPLVFRIADVRAALPGVSDQTIRLVLDAMKAEELIAPEGTGRSAVWGKRPHS